MKKRKILVILVVLAAAAGAAWYFISSKKSVAVHFTTAAATPGYIAKSITATGTMQPLDTVTVGSQVSGVVKNIFADYNSIVKKGQLLATIDPSIIKAQSDQSRASLASARSNLAYQKSNYERQSKLYTLGAISQADYQVAMNQYHSSIAAVNNVLAQLNITLKTLSYTNIYSPITGVVLNRNVSAGQTIASSFNAPVLFVIAKDLTKMQVRADVDEADIGGVLPGQKASFTVDAFPDNIFRGSVREILLHASVSANVVTYTTLINVNNNSLQLKPGMTASINIYSAEDSNALLIPSRALGFKPDSVLLKKYTLIKAPRQDTAQHKTSMKKPTPADTTQTTFPEKTINRVSYVWILSGNTLTEKKIITGLNDDTNVIVITGLAAGDEVITAAAASTGNAPTDNTQKSPFMPSMKRNTSIPKSK